MIPQEAKNVFTGQVFSVWQWPQRLFDGSTAVFEAVSRPDTSHTVGVMPDGRIMLVEDSQPHREAVITPAGGVIDAGETPEEAAKREFREETGYTIGELIHWHQYDPGIKLDWTVFAFIGRGVTYEGPPMLEAGEKITPCYFRFEEFLMLGTNPRLRDKVIRIILLEALLDPVKKESLRTLLYGE
ncbi:MAG TPA: NUDIX hydrolase [Candidatus Andersenbacteria bacterium]|nr:MAG: hypothetical protein A2854_05150 [Parcubacteria group bacterium RIFCSPHIGHO2_01_FULL_56_18]HLD26035.1 NUDIX hydrolase [Candidatus Andersenbacteria bacterium]